LCSILIGAALEGQTSTAEYSYPRFSLADLRSDFDNVTTILTTATPQLYTDRTELAAAIVAQRATLRDQMNELEFFRVLSPLVRRLNCGHSGLDLSSVSVAAVAQQKLLPYSVAVIDNRLYVTRSLPDAAIPVGAEILSINGHSAAEIIPALYDGMTADGANLTLKRVRLNSYTSFRTLYYLHVDTSPTFATTYASPLTRAPVAVEVAGRPTAETAALDDPARVLTDGVGASEFAPDYALLSVATFNFYDAASQTRYNGFIDRFFDEAAQRHSPCVILDLRGNGGGDPNCGSYLVRHLLAAAVPYFSSTTPYYPNLVVAAGPTSNAFSGPVYILIDGGCFSTTGHVCSLLSYHHRGTFIGEETGGSFACTAATRTVTLTRTQLRLTYSTATFSTAVAGLTPGRGILPEYETVPTVADVLAGRDVTKEFALSLLREGAPKPVISREPSSQIITENGTAVFSVEVAAGAPRYQWSKDGVNIAGATSPHLVLTRCGADSSGAYNVTVTNPSGSVVSAPATLAVVPRAIAGFITNVSVRTLTGSGDRALIVGFAMAGAGAGSNKALLLRGVGPSLRTFGVPDTVADPAIELYAQATGTRLDANDDWQGASPIIATAARVGAFPLTDAASKDSALLASLPPGPYTVRAVSAGEVGGTVLAEVYDADAPGTASTAPRLMNISARAPVSAGNPLIAGFVIAGDAAKTVLIRGIGPGLVSFVGDTALADPTLELYRHEDGTAQRVARNEAWSGAPQLIAMARQVGAFPLTDTTSKDAALLLTLPPGAYSVHVTTTATSGLALAEVYAVE
jgi:hypothetical protein